MIIQQRVMTARFAEKARKKPDFAKQLGLEVYYTEDRNFTGGKSYEEDNTDGRDETDGNPDVEGNNIH